MPRPGLPVRRRATRISASRSRPNPARAAAAAAQAAWAWWRGSAARRRSAARRQAAEQYTARRRRGNDVPHGQVTSSGSRTRGGGSSPGSRRGAGMALSGAAPGDAQAFDGGLGAGVVERGVTGRGSRIGVAHQVLDHAAGRGSSGRPGSRTGAAAGAASPRAAARGHVRRCTVPTPASGRIRPRAAIDAATSTRTGAVRRAQLAQRERGHGRSAPGAPSSRPVRSAGPARYRHRSDVLPAQPARSPLPAARPPGQHHPRPAPGAGRCPGSWPDPAPTLAAAASSAAWAPGCQRPG